MTKDLIDIRSGFETAYIDGSVASSLAYRPQFVSNNYMFFATRLSITFLRNK